MKKTSAITLLLTICSTCLAYYPTVRNFTKETYRSGSQNWAVTQGSGGNMWFGNQGILEYDGDVWSTYQTLNYTSVRSLLYDEQTDRLYFGATDEFGYLHISGENEMEYVSLTDSLANSIGEIWAIHKTGETLWLRGNNRIIAYDAGKAVSYSFDDKIGASTIVDGEIMIFVNNSGAFWSDEDNVFREVEGSGFLKDKRVCSILKHGDSLIFVTATDGLFILTDGRLSEFEISLSRKLMKDNVYCAASDGRHLAFGTVRNGVYIKDIIENTTIHIDTDSGLQNNTVLSMYFDHQHNLWLGLDRGIDIVELGSPEFRLFEDPNRFGAGYASEIFRDRMWLGTNQGLYSTSISSANDIPDSDRIIEISEVKGQVWSLKVYDDCLFCCHDKGIHIMKDGSARHIAINGAWKLEALKDRPEMLLGSSYERLFLLRKESGEWKFYGYLDGFDEASKVFEEDKDGRIWFSHWLKGLFRLTIDYDSLKVTRQEYFSRNEGFPEDWNNTPMELNGEIIFQTAAGFYNFDRYNNQAYPHEHLNSMFSSAPGGTSIHITPENEFYFSSSRNQTFRYKDDDRIIMDSISLSGLARRRIVGFEDIRSISGNMIMVNTEDGFSLIRTDRLKTKLDSLEHDIYIREISLTQAYDSTIFMSRSNKSGNETGIELPYSHNSMKFKTILPAYSSDSKPMYSFLLENFDDDWSAFTEENFKEYTKLPHGRYIFRARARTPESDKISETSISILIKAPWYMTGWACLAYAVMLAVSVMTLINVMKFIMQKRTAQIEKENEEKMLKKQMQLDLEHKAQDLAASTMNVIRKNEILLEIDSELEKVSGFIAEDRNKSLKMVTRIRHEIQENIQHDDIWSKFEKNFDIVYNDFLKRLGEQYPHLTVSDKKMCAYLKMDLSSKEIAPLLNLTVRSVEMTRYRLRKKLGLTREENLTVFLQNF